MGFKEHNDFRKSSRWVNFSSAFIRSKGRKCEICGIMTAKFYNTHHKFKDDYENLAKNRFMCICRECHSYLHRRQKQIPTIAKNIKKFTWK